MTFDNLAPLFNSIFSNLHAHQAAIYNANTRMSQYNEAFSKKISDLDESQHILYNSMDVLSATVSNYTSSTQNTMESVEEFRVKIGDTQLNIEELDKQNKLMDDTLKEEFKAQGTVSQQLNERVSNIETNVIKLKADVNHYVFETM
eukprot:CAMPEP_0201284108 /NCGR_PEP_ID=MMETSP1317-20130820/61814_1 /ASSEMBLY_ACC=CAM_ASM_000770 /TAXON_ID=187299 /ORGANISM="Undescribed Undescribed, Strain Undescribed" /LENGTH=145 /DNA_ID=CAMNT_0047602811 /DNA_START=26 /DNA_END=463 /DNA_ORIENTATION=+